MSGPITSGCFGALGHHFHIECSDALLSEYAQLALESLRDLRCDSQPVCYELVVRRDWATLSIAGRPLAGGTRGHVADWLVWHIREGARWKSGDDIVVLHAAAVQRAGTTVLIPGPSGTGKSTLTAALVRRGFRYAGDDIVALDRATCEVIPCPTPVRLTKQAMNQLGIHDPMWPQVGDKSYVAVTRLNNDPVAAVRGPISGLVVTRVAPIRMSFGSLGPAEAVATLAMSCTGVDNSPRVILPFLTRALAGAWRLRAQGDQPWVLAGAIMSAVDTSGGGSTFAESSFPRAP